MFQQILATQWKSVRTGLGLMTIVSFGLPLMAIQNLGRPVPSSQGGLWYGGLDGASVLFYSWGLWVPFFPILAAAIGAVLALNAWNWDHRDGHTYALSMPISRGRYALFKAGAGALLLLIPVVGLGVGSVAATMSVTIPAGLQAYPFHFTIRFLMAGLLIYATFFALASGTIRTALLVLGGVVALMVGGEIAVDFVASFIPGDVGFSPTRLLFEKMTTWPGPFSVITGNWMLIDV